MDKLNKEDYNNEPVYYCSECLSLRIRDIDGTDYCDKCGSTNIEQTHIQEWEQMYNRKYYGNYLNLGK
jgi:hypothetical protein